MQTLCMLLDKPTESHLKCLDGIRGYLKKHQLDWDLRMLDPGQVDLAPADAWWITFHHKDVELLPASARHRSCNLFGNNPESCTQFDPTGFAQLAVNHLKEQGYQTIGVVDGNKKSAETRIHQAIEEHCQAQALVFTSHRHTNPAHIHELKAWLHESPHPLAIYAYSDPQAAWLRNLITETGLQIPQDIALLGTGDHPKICLEKEPTLSSLAYPWPLMGEAAAHQLHHRILGSEPPPPLPLRPYSVSIRASTAKRGIRDPLVRRAHVWLKNNLTSKRPLQEAAAHCGCSIQSLCLHFQAELGSSPKQQHDQLRCEKAVELLTDPHNSINAIAKKCGFSSSTAFGVSFKRRYACSPSEWRKAAI